MEDKFHVEMTYNREIELLFGFFFLFCLHMWHGMLGEFLIFFLSRCYIFTMKALKGGPSVPDDFVVALSSNLCSYLPE